jgi:P4 family phage/plasmid primase-like protien
MVTTTPPHSVALAVAVYRSFGWATIRVKGAEKAPIGKWQDREFDPPEDYGPSDNIGVKLGEPSKHLVDVDLDSESAVHLAPLHLPKTATFGRRSKPKSHWLYYCQTRTQKPSHTHIELRSTGCQTVFPGSIHVSGEPITWTSADEVNPLDIQIEELMPCFGRLCAAAIIADAVPALDGQVHDFTLAMAGALYHSGWTLEDALHLILPAMELYRPDRGGHREQAIRDTFDDSNDRNRRGWPSLETILNPGPFRALQLAIGHVHTIPRKLAAQLDAVAQGRAPMTDVGNAERFVADHSTTTRYIRELGWHEWDGRRWVEVEKPMAQAIATARKMQTQGVDIGDVDLTKWGVKAEAAGRISAMLAIAQALPAMQETAKGFDRETMALNTPSGIVDLTTGKVYDHNPDARHTRMTAARFVEDSECPRFLEFIAELFPGDEEVQQYVLRYLGYCLTAETSEQMISVWHGDGCNGKSTLLEVVRYVMGDYAQIMPQELLTVGPGQNQAETALAVARLRGVRFAACAEVDQGRRWNEALLKTLTGGEDVIGRVLYQGLVQISPSWKLTLSTNHEPAVRGADLGIWRRIQLVPFSQNFTERKDPRLMIKLRNEADGILTLLTKYAADWYLHGLQPPERIARAVDDYRKEQDRVRTFIDEICERSPYYVARGNEFYAAYRDWARNGGEHALGRSNFFKRAVTFDGIEKQRDADGNVEFAGVKVKAGWDALV